MVGSSTTLGARTAEPSAPSAPRSAPSAARSARAVAVLGVSEPLIVSGPRDRRLSAIAARQRGRVSRRQLIAAGLRAGQVHHLLRGDRLFRLHAGVYAVGHPGPVPLGRETAALLAVQGDPVLSHVSVAALWGIDAITADPEAIHLLVDADVDSRRPGICAHRSRTLAPADRRVRDGLPVCSVERMFLDLASELGERTFERAFDQALVRGVVSHRAIDEILARAGGHHGRRALRELTAGSDTGTITRSQAEELLLVIVRRADVPEPLVNTRLHGHEVDFLWPDARLVVEVDGYRFHSTRAAFERDRIRDARLQAAGFEVLRVTWRSLEREPLAVIARIAAALVRRTSRERLDVTA